MTQPPPIPRPQDCARVLLALHDRPRTIAQITEYAFRRYTQADAYRLISTCLLYLAHHDIVHRHPGDDRYFLRPDIAAQVRGTRPADVVADHARTLSTRG